ncbi:hypothetical protein F4819DRAFT_482960 [Hypoxylon fuscum]|nr:hypothetical protein F4819DRAFT_482960 [Hypoxylon fuscum]
MRIAPNELHVDDPDYWNNVHGRGPQSFHQLFGRAGFQGATASTLRASHWNTHFRVVRQLMDSLPDRFLCTLMPLFRPILERRAGIIPQVNEILSDMEEGEN